MENSIFERSDEYPGHQHTVDKALNNWITEMVSGIYLLLHPSYLAGYFSPSPSLPHPRSVELTNFPLFGSTSLLLGVLSGEEESGSLFTTITWTENKLKN